MRFEGREQVLFQPIRVDFHSAPDDLLSGCAFVAQLAGSDLKVAELRRGTERAAGNGTRGVEVAAPGLGIERWARLFVESRRKKVRILERSGDRVARVLRTDGRDVLGSPAPHLPRALRIDCFKLPKALAEPDGVELRDRERTVAALGTTRAADDPRPASPLRLAHGGIDDAKELAIAGFDLDEAFHGDGRVETI